MTRVPNAALFSAIGIAGLAAGVGASTVLTPAFSPPAGWLILGFGLALAGSAGALLLQRSATAPIVETVRAGDPPTVPTPPQEGYRRLRHDIRGALSPALLTADRLLMHADPAVQRAGDIMVRAIEKAAALLNDPAAEATPPDHS